MIEFLVVLAIALTIVKLCLEIYNRRRRRVFARRRSPALFGFVHAAESSALRRQASSPPFADWPPLTANGHAEY